MKSFRLSGPALWSLVRQWAIVSGRDAMATTRASLVSIEARVGAAVFVALALGAAWRLPPGVSSDLGAPAATWALARAWHAGRLWAWGLVLILVHAAVGAAWGLAVKNAWGLLGRVYPRAAAVRFRTGLVAAFTGALVLLAHGLLLWRDMGRHPALYEALRPAAAAIDGWQWVAVSVAPRGVSAAALLVAGTLLGAAFGFVAWRWRDWFWGFSRPTRMAIGVLGGAAVLFGTGLWGVRRVQRERNAGPNVLLITVDGLRTTDLRSAAAPGLAAWASEGQVWARCVPAVDAQTPAFLTALSGVSPLTHGVRHDFPSRANQTPPPDGDLGPAPDTLTDFFRRKGAWVAALSGPGGEFFERHADAFDDRRAPPRDAAAVLRRRSLERSRHLLPYLSGRWGRVLFPGLRGSPALADPALLAADARRWLRRARFRSRFFLWVHFADPAGPVASPIAARRLAKTGRGSFRPSLGGEDSPPSAPPGEQRRALVHAANLAALDRAFHALLNDLSRFRLSANTTVALWSPRASPLTRAEASEARALRGGPLFNAPFAFQSPGAAQGVWRNNAVRAVDVPATLVAAGGGTVPDEWEGVSLLRGVGLPADERGIVYTEAVWPDPRGTTAGPDAPSPLADMLMEDRDAPGEWRIDPAQEDALVAGRSRLLQWGAERLIYHPAADRVVFEYFRLGPDGTPGPEESATPAGAARVRDLKEVFYRYLAREAGRRPQNEYWIPEALLRHGPAEKGTAHDR